MGRSASSVVAAVGLVGLLAVACVHAGVGDGPAGGSVAALTIDPHIATTLYARTGGGVFKSTNGGESWTALH